MMDELAQYDLRINSGGAFESYKHGVWKPGPLFKDYDLLVFTSGVGTCLINGRECAVSANDVLLIRRGDRVEKAFSAGRMANLFVHFDFLGRDGQPTDPPTAILPPRRPFHVNSLVITHMTQAIMARNWENEHVSALALLRAILLLLAGHQEAPSRDFHARHRERILAEFASRILKDPAPRRSVADLAAEAGMSTVQFTRCFRRHTGHPPGEFMVLARIERARLLLTTTSRTLSDIADALGFSDVHYFTRQFASKTGVPPATYRKRPNPLAKIR